MEYPTIALQVPTILLPQGIDFQKWAVIAADQYTSDPAYWKAVEEFIGNEKSTYHLIFPEVYLHEDDKEERIKRINQTMKFYVQEKIFRAFEGFVLVERETTTGIRKGLLIALDLEHYDFHKGSRSLIRATEGTILERLPPRIAIRKDALLELPHIMVLIDDPQRNVIEPLFTKEHELLYDFDLMMDSGHIKGYAINASEDIQSVVQALQALKEKSGGLLYAMGDGNHSLATAKAIWEEKKKQGASMQDPARYALVELVNLHDDSLIFEPIHRIIFNVENDLLEQMGERIPVASLEAMKALMEEEHDHYHTIGYYDNQTFGIIKMKKTAKTAVGTLQGFLDNHLASKDQLDYIHDDDALIQLTQKGKNIGFFLPAMKKEELFPAIRSDGALPRKTFSMGQAKDKRFYLEARMIR